MLYNRKSRFKTDYIQDNYLRKYMLEEIYERTVSEGYDSSEILEKIRSSPDDSSRSSIRRQLQKKLSTDNGESSNIKRGVPQTNEHKRNSIIKLSDEIKERDNKYLESVKSGIPTVNSIRRELQKLYGDLKDGIANTIAIEVGTTIYKVDSLIENGIIDFGVRRPLLNIFSNHLRKERINIINGRAVSKGFVSSEILGRLGYAPSNSNGSGNGRKLQKKLSNNHGQPGNIQGGVPRSNGSRGGRGLIDQAYLEAVKSGDMLTAEKMVEEAAEAAGFTQSLYHGTQAKGWTIYKLKINKSLPGSDKRKAIWFTSSKSSANTYDVDADADRYYVNLGKQYEFNANGSLLDSLLAPREIYRIVHPELTDYDFDRKYRNFENDVTYEEVRKNNDRNHKSVYASVNEYESVRRKHQGNNAIVLGKVPMHGQIGRVHKVQSGRNGKRNPQKGTGNLGGGRGLNDQTYLEAVKSGDMYI